MRYRVGAGRLTLLLLFCGAVTIAQADPIAGDGPNGQPVQITPSSGHEAAPLAPPVTGLHPSAQGTP